MPPRIRTRASKAQKENIDVENKLKPSKNNTKAPRKALTDKTNSASDDASVEIPKKPKKTITKTKTVNVVSKQNSGVQSDDRPRRDRRLPNRFVENPVLVSLTNSKDSNIVTPKNTTDNTSKLPNTSVNDTPVKSNESEAASFKTPSKTETSLVVSRPRRICRLPSRFEDHLVSPNKYIPIQPDNASTPIQLSKTKPVPTDVETKTVGKKDTKVLLTRSAKITALQKKVNDNSLSDKSSPDTNNNAKGRSTRVKKTQPPTTKKASPENNSIKKFFNKTVSPQLSPTKKVSLKRTNGKRIIDQSLSFKVLEGKKRSQGNDKQDLDIYEFTFDPNEEPQPQKKKRKKPATKRPVMSSKPKSVVTYKSTYDQNISKALLALKKAVNPSKAAPAKLPQINEISDEAPEPVRQNHDTSSRNHHANHVATMNDTGKTSVHECNYPSIRVEDIAADIEPSEDHLDLNYSPVNSPRPTSPVVNTEVEPGQIPEKAPANDPLNLQEDLSFFDDVPVASSSMNMSVRHPLASPWRVEFGSLPIKWHSNTYVKANMTPAVESSFICSEESNKKKHVYTNLVPETDDALPQIVSNTSFKQTSILSFIKEVAEKKAQKKRGRSVSPTKAMPTFNDIEVEDNVNDKDHIANENNSNPMSSKNTSVEASNDTSNNKENAKEGMKTRKRKNEENICSRPHKSPRKQKDKDCTYFGFDDSENLEQENVSPVKVKVPARGRSLRPRSRGVLQEINGPTRAALPLAAKSKVAASSEAVNRVYEELKSAADAPVFPEKNVEGNVTNVEALTLNEDSESVHLFEDIDLVHHLKPTRKSYGKAKKVTFQQHASSDSDVQGVGAANDQSSFEDDLADLTFEVPNIKEKKTRKKKPKKLMSKKEEKEAEEWAAGFNSMCEEIEDFPLVVE